MEQKSTRAKLRNVRLSYVNLLTPNTFEGQADAKYRCDVLIRKDDAENVAALKAAMNEAVRSGLDSGAFKGMDEAQLKRIREAGKWHNPLKDGDTDKPDDPAYKGCYFISPWKREDDAPQIVDIKGNRITIDTPNATDMVYSGVYGHITVSFFPYKNLGNYGVGVYLGNFLTLETGEKLGGGKNAMDDFSEDFTEAKEKVTNNFLGADEDNDLF